MPFFEREGTAAILQIDAGLTGNQAAAPGIENAVDEGARITVFVDHRQIYGVFVTGQQGLNRPRIRPVMFDSCVLAGGKSIR